MKFDETGTENSTFVVVEIFTLTPVKQTLAEQSVYCSIHHNNGNSRSHCNRLGNVQLIDVSA